jgi:hypothetical protein
MNGAPLWWVVYCIASVTFIGTWMTARAVRAVLRRRGEAGQDNDAKADREAADAER